MGLAMGLCWGQGVFLGGGLKVMPQPPPMSLCIPLKHSHWHPHHPSVSPWGCLSQPQVMRSLDPLTAQLIR